MILVPQESVQDSAEGFYVYVVKDEGDKKIAQKRNIKATEQYNGFWVVDEGLKVGESVVVQGINSLNDGSVLKILKTDSENDLNKDVEKTEQ